jgi:thioredoxin 1
MMPAVQELARELGGRLKVATMDVSRNFRIPSLFEVRGTPAFVLMKGGREAARFVGAMPKEELFRRIQPYI